MLEVAISTLQYYDKAYTFGLEKREKQTVSSVPITNADPKENALVVGNWIKNIEWKK